MLRGAPLTQYEKWKLNKLGKDILWETGVRYGGDDYDILRKEDGWAGFASFYIGCKAMWDKTYLVNKADVNIYKQLITIDQKMGTKMTEQLERCVQYSYRKDLFKV